MRPLVVLVILIQFNLSLASDCNEFFRQSTFSSESLKTNHRGLFKVEKLKPLANSNLHIDQYYGPVRGVLMASMKYFESSSVFHDFVQEHYGLEANYFRYRPFLKKKLEQWRLAKYKAFVSLVEDLEQRLTYKNITYDWVVSTTLRATLLLDVFPLGSLSSSTPVQYMGPKLKAQILKRALSERMGDESSFGNGFYKNAIEAFPEHIILPYFGELTDEDFGNALVQGVHYINLMPGQIRSHESYKSSYHFAAHDFMHLELIHLNTSDGVDQLETWSSLPQIRRQLVRYIEDKKPSEDTIKELQKMLFVILHEQPRSLENYKKSFLTGTIPARELEFYLRHAEDALSDFDRSRHLTAIQNYFNWAQESLGLD